MSFPRRRLEAPALELAPLVDVLFLLLVFFMVATRFPDPPGAITVVRPAVSAQGAVPERAVRLSLTAEGVAALQGTPLPEARSARLEALRQAAAAGRSELSLAADQAATHGEVLALLALAEQAGFSSLKLETQHKKEGKRAQP